MTESQPLKPRIFKRMGGKLQSEIKPIVLEYEPKKKKKNKSDSNENKEKYSEGLGDIQEMEGNMLRIAKRAAKAASKGLDTYDQERQRSAQEKTDGAIEDFFNNSAKATSVFLKETSEIPVDMAEAMYTKSYRKRMRKNMRRTSRFIRLFRI